MNNRINSALKPSQEHLLNWLKSLQGQGGLTRDQYIRYLSMQYHLTNGVHRHFFMVAAHESFFRRRKFREFLFNFAMEEERHFEIAKTDLAKMGEVPLPCPIDVELWHLYYNSVIPTRPFLRLGATCVLENLTKGCDNILNELITKSSFLKPENTHFLQIHRHSTELPHGDQIVGQVSSLTLTDIEGTDVFKGIEIGSIFMKRMLDWVFVGQ